MFYRRPLLIETTIVWIVLVSLNKVTFQCHSTVKKQSGSKYSHYFTAKAIILKAQVWPSRRISCLAAYTAARPTHTAKITSSTGRWWLRRSTHQLWCSAHTYNTAMVIADRSNMAPAKVTRMHQRLIKRPKPYLHASMNKCCARVIYNQQKC